MKVRSVSFRPGSGPDRTGPRETSFVVAVNVAKFMPRRSLGQASGSGPQRNGPRETSFVFTVNVTHFVCGFRSDRPCMQERRPACRKLCDTVAGGMVMLVYTAATLFLKVDA